MFGTLTVIAGGRPLPHELNALVDLFEDPAEAIGALLRDEREAAAIERVLSAARTITGGPREHPRWPEVVTAAAAAQALFAGTG